MRQQIERKRVRPGFDVREPASPLDHGPHDFLAGGVAEGVDDAVVAMAAFAAQGEAAGFEVEMRAPFDQFADPLGRLANDHLDHLAIAELAAGGERVGDVVLEAVFGIPNAGDAPLGIGAVRLMQLSLLTTTTESRGSVAIAARRPASPPPMISTSEKACGTRLGWKGTR